jgi:hypothetical protein
VLYTSNIDAERCQTETPSISSNYPGVVVVVVPSRYGKSQVPRGGVQQQPEPTLLVHRVKEHVFSI